jgi:hypothetical protein
LFNCEHRKFIDDLVIFNDKLKDAFSAIKKDGGLIVIPLELPPVLDGLASAFAEVDLALIGSEIERLKSMPLENALKAEIEQIIDSVVIMDYDDAAGRIDKLLGRT